jgi:hypothetical protein
LWLFSMKGRNLYELVEMSAQLVVDVLTAPDEPTLAAAWGVLAWAGAWAVIIAFCAAVATKYGSHIIAFCAAVAGKYGENIIAFCIAFATVATGGVIVAMLLLPLTIKLQSAGMIGRDDQWWRLSRDDHLLIDKLLFEILACNAAFVQVVIVVAMSCFIVVWLCSLGVCVNIFSREPAWRETTKVACVVVLLSCSLGVIFSMETTRFKVACVVTAHHMQLSANCEAAAAHAMQLSANLEK